MRTYFYLFLLVLVIVPLAVHGQASNNNFVPLQPGIPGVKEFATSGSIPDLLNNIYKICIGVAATLAVLQIMRAGVMYMGGDSITEKKEARNLISMSVIGLVLVLSPVIVFSIINPDILSLKLGAIQLDPTSSQGGQNPYASSTNEAASQVCSVAYTNPKIAPSTAANACSSLVGEYVGAPNVCCKGLTSSGTCCAKKSTSGAGSIVQITSNAINLAMTTCGITLTDQQKGCVVSQASFVGQGFSSCTSGAQTCSAAVGKSLLDACVPAANSNQRVCVYAAFAKAATPK